MSYIRKRLADQETIAYEGEFHWLQKLAPWLALLLLGWLIIGIIIWFVEFVRLKTTEFVVTNRRIILKRGWLNVKLEEMNLGSIEGGRIDQNVLGRIFGFGKLLISGRGEMAIPFPTMAHPSRFRAQVENARIVKEDEPQVVAPLSGPEAKAVVRRKRA